MALVCAKDIKKNFLYVENFLMSCRILGRYLEYSIVNELAKICKKRKVKQIIFQFISTKKNQPVKNFINDFALEKLNNNDLKKMSLSSKGCTYYSYDMKKKIPFIEIYEK